nr:enolase C-terminal domain-like protein [Phaeacidiphilus oryzae]
MRQLIGEPVVEALRATIHAIPTDAPESDATLDWDVTTMVLVEVVAAGHSGIGWTYGSPAVARVVTGRLTEAVLGRDAMDVPGANAAMATALRNDGRPGMGAEAVSAVDIALWDLKARILGVPLARLFGRVREDVPVYGSGGFTSYGDERLARQLEGWVGEQGIPRVKIKIGEGWGGREDRDLERTRLAREVVGEDTELYVDANGGYSRKQAVRVSHALEPYRVAWFEEPVSSDDLAGLREVRELVRPDVAAGEYGWDLPGLTRMASSGAVDCLQADATRCGGLTVWLRAAAVAEGLGLELSGHGAPHVHASVAAAVPNLRHLEWFHDHARIEAMLFEGALSPDGGVLRPGADGAPGLGLRLRPQTAEEYRTA